jgi:DNA-binding NarL/FixJ family response regulator
VALTFADAFKKAVDQSFDIFLADLAVSDCDGMRSLQNLIAVAKQAPVVTITSVHDEAQALKLSAPEPTITPSRIA